jgi:hypothetical protein
VINLDLEWWQFMALMGANNIFILFIIAYFIGEWKT